MDEHIRVVAGHIRDLLYVDYYLEKILKNL
jgi:hypothetical protein